MPVDLADLLGAQESAVLEFKREVTSLDAVRTVVCALSNDLAGRGGGDLLIGVDDHGRPHPTPTDDATLLRYLAVRDGGELLPRPSMTVETATYGGQAVVRIHVNATDLPPMRLRGVAWVRPGPQSVRATANDERILVERRRAAQLPFDARGLDGATVADLDQELLGSTYVPAAVDPEVLEENDRPASQQLASLSLLDLQGRATPTGLIVGGYDPTAWLPGAYVLFVRYAGPDVAADVTEELEIRDNLITATRTLTALIQAHVVRHPTADDVLTEREASSYPEAALREVLMNAVMHRALESTNAPLRVQWFDDRVEMSNPGGPFGVVNRRNYDRVTDYRNPTLASAMKTLGLVNRFGRGIGRTRSLMETNGNPPPEFIIDDASWTVVLRGAR